MKKFLVAIATVCLFSINIAQATYSPSLLDFIKGVVEFDISMNSKKITNLATPTNDNDAATKKYVDDNAGGSIPFVGITKSPDPENYPNDGMFTGNMMHPINGTMGYKGANDLCKQFATGSTHICTQDEILKTISSVSNLATLSTQGWEDDVSVWIATGAPKALGAYLVNDCLGFTYAGTSTNYGNFWKFNTGTGGSGAALLCNNSLRIACCK